MAIQREGRRIYVRGAVTFDNVVEITRQGMALLDEDGLVVDMAEVIELDSSAISMLFEWLRVAHARNQQLYYVNLPENLSSLMQLYGVTDFIPFDTNITK
ncbi:lipid asymmetry maintenance protein MlaB [Nitrosomonas sp. Nm33]|uniref:STAS domain-containing protein n=1 Tax=Nitrosomonas sp. Nm33 TaxID=133724 RepID=UPI0008961467|nr:STAS domain-containing protein [Nitrosomonas sp. Nm33]SDY71946.1 phospholipid transport system transporter-binding protein [Nitrosomonas sp. Nm33]